MARWKWTAGVILPLAGVAIALSALVAGDVAAAAAPEGPRLAFVKWSTKPQKLELLSVGATGSDLRRIAGGGVGPKRANATVPTPFEGPAWSPDGTQIAYGGGTGKSRAIWLGAADGSDLHVLPGTSEASGPVFGPDGHTIAFSRSRLRQHVDVKEPWNSRLYFSTSAWLYDLDTGAARRLTPWRNGLVNEPTSFSPDGSTLAMSRSEKGAHDVVALGLESGTATKVLVHSAEDAVYSPDGTRIAFVSYRDRNQASGMDGPVLASELYVRNLDGSKLKRLTFTREDQESSPSWDPSGLRLAYTESSEPESLGFGNAIMQINADGSCRQTIVAGARKKPAPLAPGLYGPAWEPGAGRDAGRINCVPG